MHDVLKTAPLLGAHLSTGGGVSTVFDRAREVGATAVQIFVKNNKAYTSPPISLEESRRFAAAWEASDVVTVVAHAGYLINLGASNPLVLGKSRISLADELVRCTQLKIPYLVLHPGAHTGAGVDVGIAQIGRELTALLRADTGDTQILLETAAGQGTTLGATFEEMRALYDSCAPDIRHRLGVCLDTCHVFAAGYPLMSYDDYESLWREFDAIVGRSLLKVIHLNDSREGVGSKKDRHANLGTGHIPLAVLQCFAHDARLVDVAIVLETPSEDGITEYRHELSLLRSV